MLMSEQKYIFLVIKLKNQSGTEFWNSVATARLSRPECKNNHHQRKKKNPPNSIDLIHEQPLGILLQKADSPLVN